MSLPSPAHTLARLAALEAAVGAWAAAYRLETTKPGPVTLGPLQAAERVLLSLATDTPTTRKEV